MIGIFLALGSRIKIGKHDKWYNKTWKGFIRGFCYFYSTVIRGTPMMVQAMIFKYSCQGAGLNFNNVLTGIPVFDGWLIAGLVVITLNTAAYMGEIVKSGLNGISKGQIEAARSLGMTRNQSMFSVALPQAIKNSIPTIGSEWIVNIKDSSVLSVIGVFDLMFATKTVVGIYFKQIEMYAVAAVCYLCLTMVASWLLGKFAKHLSVEPQPLTSVSDMNATVGTVAGTGSSEYSLDMKKARQ
jgi:putative lysine transport system permease protein